jgi:protein subunit release factor A
VDERELKIDLYRRGVGGQQVGSSYDLQVTHIPTGIKVYIPYLHRSQHLTRAWAIEAIETILTHPRFNL